MIICVTVCPPCVSSCVPDRLRMSTDFLSIKWHFLIPFPLFFLMYCLITVSVSRSFFSCPLKACLHSEGHMDDGLTLQRCQHEESRAARIIRNTTLLFNRFIRYAKHCSTPLLSLTSAGSDVIAQIAQLSQITVHICLGPLY